MNSFNQIRRDFLLLVAGGALTSFTGIALPKAQSPSPMSPPNPLSFVDVTGLGPPQKPSTIEDEYCPLHKEKIIPGEAIPLPQYNAAQEMLKQELALTGVPWEDSFTVTWTLQHYGVPDESTIIDQLLEYCVLAQDFLYRQVQGLFSAKPTWSVLARLENCPSLSGRSFRAYVGRFTYLVIRVKAQNKNGEILDPYLINVRPLERSLNFISADSRTYIPQKSAIYIIPGLTSLCSPFSELLHLSTNQAAIGYGTQLAEDMELAEAQEQAHLLSETVVEAMSISIAQQFLQNNRHNNRLQQLSTLAQHMYEYLPDLDVALAYCLSQGPQECFDRFKTDPGLLFEQMQEYRSD